MLLKLKGGTVIDPAHGVKGEVRDVFVEHGRIIADPGPATQIHQEIDASGMIVMAGAIDLHTHIGGGKVNIARAMLPEDHRGDLVDRTALTRSGCGHAVPSTLTTGYRYAEMGYTACFEPAMLPINARQAHMEMGDTPIVDKGAYAMLGSDDFLLRMLAANQDQRAINDYVAWTITHAQAIGLKVVNPGGITAFKFNQRMLDLDEQHAYYRVTPRQILKVLARAVHEIGVPHPLHVHGCNLGVPGNVDTTLATMDAVEGLPIHLTHIQFHSYGTEGERKFSSGAGRIAEAINNRPNVSADVGQIMFGQTVTASGDNMAQYRNAGAGSPKKSVVMDIECDAGCGVVPFRYRDQNFVNALQWAIGLEMFLLVDDPWRIFLTTDHPNGAPFTSYPHLIRLLMDKTFRNEKLAGLHPDAQQLSDLGAHRPRVLAVRDRDHDARGAGAHARPRRPRPPRARRGGRHHRVPARRESGDHVREASLRVQGRRAGGARWRDREGDLGQHPRREARVRAAIEHELAPYFERYHTMRIDNFKIGDDEMCECGHGSKLIRHDAGWRVRREAVNVNGVAIDDTFAEAFGMRATRVLVTAQNLKWAYHAANTATGFATSVIACGCEAGIERKLDPSETPDGRPGASLLFFAMSGKELAKQVERRVGQCVLTAPTSAAFAGIDEGEPIALGKNLRFFGDGFQMSKVIGGKRYWRVPVMDGEFLCRRRRAWSRPSAAAIS